MTSSIQHSTFLFPWLVILILVSPKASSTAPWCCSFTINHVFAGLGKYPNWGPSWVSLSHHDFRSCTSPPAEAPSAYQRCFTSNSSLSISGEQHESKHRHSQRVSLCGALTGRGDFSTNKHTWLLPVGVCWWVLLYGWDCWKHLLQQLKGWLDTSVLKMLCIACMAASPCLLTHIQLLHSCCLQNVCL